MPDIIDALTDVAVGDDLLAADFNDEVLDGLRAVYSPPMVETFRTTTLTVNSGTTALVGFDDERFDQDFGPASTGTFHDPVTNNSRVVFPYDGLYEVEFFWQWSASPGANLATMNLRLNAAGASAGGTSLRSVLTGSDRTGSYRIRRAFIAGDYCELFATQTSGAARDLGAGASVTGIYARFIGA